MGSGKTTVSRIFSSLGIPVYHADDIAKKMYDNKDIRDMVTEVAGNDILDSTGNLNRLVLARKLFSDKELMKKVTQIIHPLVRDDFRRWINLYQWSPYIIHEAAIIFESGFRDDYDKIIHVSCPREISIERIIKRDNLSRDQIISRMSFQMEDHEKAALSDFVIINDETQLVVPQVLAIHKQLTGSKV